MAQILDGKQLAKEMKQRLAEEVAQLKQKGKAVCLAVVLVGEDPGSVIYVRNKIKDCEETGIESRAYKLSENTTEQELLGLIDQLNADASVDGILVQFPLPKHLSEMEVIHRISPLKDVDGFCVESAGSMLVGGEGFVSCTPAGAMELIKSSGIHIGGKHAVVIGRSNNVGKPMALLLLQENATVTVCHSKTVDLADICMQADILVAAVGRPRMIKADMVKPGAVVIDIGISRIDGKQVGDVDFEEVEKTAGAITPNPGGTGPMTRAMLMYNTVKAARMHG